MKNYAFKRLGMVLLSLGFFAVTVCYGAPYHAWTPYQKKLVSKLRHSHVQVIKQAEVLKIVIPTDRFFRSQTTRLRRSCLESMGKIVSLMKSYTAAYKHPRIRVSGYTDTVFSPKRRQKLSTGYAKTIAAYLWNNGVPERWIRVKGYGARHPIASNRTPAGAAFNRRVVIRIEIIF